MQEYWDTAKQWLMANGIRVLVITIIVLVAVKITKSICRRIFGKMQKGRDTEFQKRTDTLAGITSGFLGVVILIIGLIMILGQFGIQIGPILAAMGVVGLAVGFGAQHLVRDVINGFFILMEDQIRVGDVVQIAGKGGLVEKINLRLTVLRDLAGNVHFVRNGEISIVTNMTKDYSRYVFEIGVAYREDIDEVIEVLKQIDEQLRNDPEYKDDILEPIEILGLDQFADSAIIIKARTKTKPIKQWSIGREFNKRMKKKFDELGIEIPFPHLTLYMGQEKDGTAAPMNIRKKLD